MSTVLISAEEFDRYQEQENKLQMIHKLAMAKWSEGKEDGWLKVMEIADPSVDSEDDIRERVEQE